MISHTSTGSREGESEYGNLYEMLDELLVDEVPTDLKCPIHMGVFIDPLVDACGHIFCKKCLANCFRRKLECPISRRPLRHDRFNPARTVMTQVNSLRVYCVHRGSCDWRGEFSQLISAQTLAVPLKDREET
eukprot:TRINITY_DN3091_c0_g1_i4.p1 TRINITY_DN3091_c0_g1~~TRINITY_DN3091_c0_g1_i4.p1  ORF type:complete len:132 (+),score=5.73 TRINITY_DN3091_c0_g1_i4:32-427(+)